MSTFTIEFYRSDNGSQPAQQFIDELDEAKRLTLLVAVERILAHQGMDVVRTEYGKSLGEGLYEFRVRDKGKVALRLYFYPHGNKLILLLCGYDKGRWGEGRRENKAIARARKYLKDYRTNPPT